MVNNRKFFRILIRLNYSKGKDGTVMEVEENGLYWREQERQNEYRKDGKHFYETTASKTTKKKKEDHTVEDAKTKVDMNINSIVRVDCMAGVCIGGGDPCLQHHPQSF